MSLWDRLFGKKKVAVRPAPTPSRGQGSGVAIPFDFEADIDEVQRLEAQSQRDPKVIGRLVQVYERILGRLQPSDYPVFRAAIQNSLGIAYRNLLTGDQRVNLAKAIECYQQALRIWTPETAPFEYAGVQNNLGNAYANLPTGDRGINLTKAIACFQEALHFRTPETAPFDYAMTQTNLGSAYGALPMGDRGVNLTQAIACFQEALRIWTPETAPFDYAMAQTNLGAAYAELPTGDRGANLAQAIVCYQEALRFRTPETAPFEYATTQTNLGNAYAELPTGDRGANLAQAIACYQEALRFYTPETALFEYALTQNNLGTAYAELPTGDRGTNLAQAIACYQEALCFRTPETVPFEYATTQTNLGAAYRALPTGDRGANLAQAIACYQEALRFHTPETAPFDYALTQNNLGNTYSNLPTGDQGANLTQAITCFKEALCFRTPETAPGDCRITNRNLANLYFRQQDWDSALAAYRAAMDAGERLYRAGLSTESKATEVARNADLYRHTAFATARLGNTGEALLTLERGKTRLLAEALRLRVPRPIGVPDDAWTAFEQAGAAVHAAQFRDTAMSREERDPVQAYNARIQNAKAANATLDAAIEQVRTHAPDFLRAIDLPTLQALIPDEHTALVTFCITDQGSMVFVLSHASSEPVQMIEVPNFTQTYLDSLLIERDTEGKPNGGWLGDYWSRDQSRWQRTMDQALAQIGKQLIAPVVATLSAGIQKLILLPTGGLFLLPLHAVPFSDGDSDRLCDRYQISYAPSAEVLADSRAKATRASGQALYAVINPEADPRLVFTPMEGVAIASLFKTPRFTKGGTAPRKPLWLEYTAGPTCIFPVTAVTTGMILLSLAWHWLMAASRWLSCKVAQ
jgi:tetratricopeptide (TPR) repeat protein